MGWETDLFALFDDLEQHAGTMAAAERGPEVADRGRAEYRAVTLASRLMASVGTEVTIGAEGLDPITGTLDRVADGWLLLAAGDHDWVLNQAAVISVLGASIRSVPEVAWSPLAKLPLASALRRIAEAGERCVLHLRNGQRYDGTLRRIGADFCELVVGDERRMVLVPFSGLAAAQSRG